MTQTKISTAAARRAEKFELEQARWIRGAFRIPRKILAEPGSGVVPNRAERRRAKRKAQA